MECRPGTFGSGRGLTGNIWLSARCRPALARDQLFAFGGNIGITGRAQPAVSQHGLPHFPDAADYEAKRSRGHYAKQQEHVFIPDQIRSRLI